MVLSATLGRTSRVVSLLYRQPTSTVSVAARLHTSSILRAEVSEKDPQLGDYPQLPFVNLQNRRYDPRWWDPQEKRNFGETVSILLHLFHSPTYRSSLSLTPQKLLTNSCMNKMMSLAFGRLMYTISLQQALCDNSL